MTLLWKRSNRYEKMWALLISACILAGGVAGCGNQAEPQGTVTQKVAEAPAKQDFKAVTSVKSGQKNVYAVVKAINGSYWKKSDCRHEKSRGREWDQCLCRRRE